LFKIATLFLTSPWLALYRAWCSRSQLVFRITIFQGDYPRCAGWFVTEWRRNWVVISHGVVVEVGSWIGSCGRTLADSSSISFRQSASVRRGENLWTAEFNFGTRFPGSVSGMR